MSRTPCIGAKLAAGLLLASGVVGCTSKEAEQKAEPAARAATTPGPGSAKPYFMPAGTGPGVWGPGDLYTLLATGDQTNHGSFQFEALVPKGGGPPPHIHHGEDESFYIVKGTLEVLLGETTYSAKAGDFVYIPRGTVHRFRNVGDETAIQLVTFVPSGMEGFFREVFPTVTDRTAAPPPITEELIRSMNEAAPKYGIEFVPRPEPAKP